MSISYMAWLCLVHTHLFAVPRPLVGVAELAIMVASLPLLLPRIPPGVVVAGALVLGLVALLTLLRGSVDPKSFRDLLIPVVFYWLGRNVGDPAIADRALAGALGVFFSLAAFELFALRTYTSVFDIYSYYISIGNMDPASSPWMQDTRLQMNGMRPPGMGRTLSFLEGVLGRHRVSSVYLEPVSAGNLAAIVAAWGLAKGGEEWRRMVGFVAAAVLIVILADSRFGMAIIPLLIAARLLLHGGSLYLPYLLPLLVGVLLLVLGATVNEVGDDFIGRLVISGQELLGFDVTRVLGVDPTAWFADMGYAQVVSQFSLLGGLALWTAFWALPLPDERGGRLRALVAIYMALILCVSGTSLFAFKSAALMWFLVGCLVLDPAPQLRPGEAGQQFGRYQGGMAA
ncbi:hypothetical protein [Halorhodospira neutriphila]|uniref:hypothetical protein n=1 Tax=Halorhodospira neutriphila TaxID=168379 RepID=UPI0019034375|nr:hypothetical protein [Halorhodospira neutriphila]